MTQSQPKAHVAFYDTTLRDGEQMPGVAFTRKQRVDIAKALDRMGIDEIEIGFAASGKAQRDDMAEVLAQGLRAKTLSLARPREADIAAAVEVGVDGVNLFIGVSDVHLEHKLRISFTKALDILQQGINTARSAGLFVSVAIEDATRTSNDRLTILAQMCADAKVDRISLADTVGVATPALMADKVHTIRHACNLPVAAHCHNDFGLAVANSLAAVEAGASVLSTTINGIGERAGNTAMEECAVALQFLYHYSTNIDLSQITKVSRLVSECSGVPLPDNKAIVGGNSFRHESGIHVAAILKNPSTYEPFDPMTVGAQRQIVLGKTTGRAAIEYLAGGAAAELEEEDMVYLLSRIKELAESGDCGHPDVLKELIDECKNRKQPLRLYNG